MLEKISEHVYRKYMKPETDRPHLYLIQGTTRSIAIDAGNSKAHVEEFYQDIQEMGLMLPSLTLLTHAHWDHTYGLHAIDHVSIASEKTSEKLEIMSHWLWTKEAMNQRLASGEEIEFCDSCIKKEYKDLSQIKVVIPTISFTNELDIQLDDIQIHIEAFENPHEEDGSFILVDDLFILGDASSPDYYHLNAKYDPKRLANFIEKLKHYPAYRFAHSHIPEIVDLPTYLSNLEEEVKENGCI